MDKPTLVTFKAAATNIGDVTIFVDAPGHRRLVPLKKNRSPLQPGDIVAGTMVIFDVDTGELQ